MDIRTLALLLGITNILQVIVIYIQYRINKTYHGIGYWALSNTSLAVGFILLILRDVISIALVSIILANTLLVLGAIFMYIGSMRFLNKKEKRGMLIGMVVLYILPFFYFTYVNNNFTIRTVILSVAISVLSFLIAQCFFANKLRSIRASANFIGGVMLAYGCFFVIRAVAALTVPPVNDIFTPTLIQTAVFLASLLEGSLATFGFIITVNQRLTAEMREAKEHFELIFSTSPDAALISRLEDGVIVNFNEGFTTLSGFTRAEAIGKSILEVNLWKNPADRQKVVKELGEKGFCKNMEAVFQRKDGSLFIGIASARTISLQGVPHIVSVTQDITEHKSIEETLRESQEKFANIIEKQTDLISRWAPDTTMSFVNQAYCTYFGASRDNLLGHPFIDRLPAETQQIIRRSAEKLVAHETDSITELERNISPAGDERWAIWVYSPLYNQQGECVEIQSVGRDITERKHLEDELHRQATTDALTGISNRRHFIELAHSELKRAIRLSHPLALVLIDLDHLKQINDTYGHAAGDQVLQAFTKTCRENTREIDVFARFGGDEFVLLLPETKREQANAAVERLRQSLTAQPVDIGGVLLSLTFSGGVSSLAGTQESLDTLLSRADQALYRAKEAGRNRIAVEQTV